jgi:hypothetical protein
MHYLFLAMLEARVATDRPFLGLHCPSLAMLHKLLGQLGALSKPRTEHATESNRELLHLARHRAIDRATIESKVEVDFAVAVALDFVVEVAVDLEVAAAVDFAVAVALPSRGRGRPPPCKEAS